MPGEIPFYWEPYCLVGNSLFGFDVCKTPKKIKNKKHHHSHKVTLPSGQSFLEGPIAE